MGFFFEIGFHHRFQLKMITNYLENDKNGSVSYLGGILLGVNVDGLLFWKTWSSWDMPKINPLYIMERLRDNYFLKFAMDYFFEKFELYVTKV